MFSLPMLGSLPPKLQLHVSWDASPGYAVLWAEDLDRAHKQRRARFSRFGKSRGHPFSADESDLRRAVRTLRIPIQESFSGALILPSGPKGPAPSMANSSVDLVGVVANEQFFRRWMVPAVRVKVTDLVLTRFVDRDWPKQIVESEDCVWLRAWLTWVDHIVANDQVTPVFDIDGDLVRGRWQADPFAETSVRARQLQLDMPVSLRALDLDRPADTFLESNAAVVVDHLKRRVLSGRSGDTGGVGRVVDLLRGRALSDRSDDSGSVAKGWVMNLLEAPDPVPTRIPDDPAYEQLLEEMSYTEPETRFGDWLLHIYLEQLPLEAAADDSKIASDPLWRVQYGLDSLDASAGSELKTSEMSLAAIETALARLTGYCPTLRPLCDLSTGPDGVVIGSNLARELLKCLPRLRWFGFNVSVPTAVTARPVIRATSLDDIADAGEAGPLGRFLDFHCGEVLIGENQMTLGALEELIAYHDPLIEIEGRWMSVDYEQAERLVHQMRRFNQTVRRPVAAAEYLEIAVAETGNDLQFPDRWIPETGWLGQTLAQSINPQEHPKTLPTPGSLQNRKLYDFQQEGLAWLSLMSHLELGALLADDMGTGKTITTISLLCHERDRNPTVSPSLVICKKPNLYENWEKEFTAHAPHLRRYIHHGRSRHKDPDPFNEQIEHADVVLTTYETALQDFRLLSSVNWDHVICDEAHRINSPDAQTTRAIHHIGARTRIALTGTPIVNRLQDTWSIMELCNPGLLGPDPGAFHAKFTSDDHDTNSRRLSVAIQPFTRRTLKTDPRVARLLPPEPIRITHECRLTSEQALIYQRVLDQMMARLETASPERRRLVIISGIQRLKLLCNHPRLHTKRGPIGPARSAKFEMLTDLLTQAEANGDRTLIYSQSIPTGKLIIKHLRHQFGWKLDHYYGDQTDPQKKKALERFRMSAGPPALMLSLGSGAEGLNLTEANSVIHVDRWWNSARGNQATARAYRLGQTKQVTVHTLVVPNSVETKIGEMIEHKDLTAATVLADGAPKQTWITQMSNARIDDLAQMLQYEPTTTDR